MKICVGKECRSWDNVEIKIRGRGVISLLNVDECNISDEFIICGSIGDSFRLEVRRKEVEKLEMYDYDVIGGEAIENSQISFDGKIYMCEVAVVKDMILNSRLLDEGLRGWVCLDGDCKHINKIIIFNVSGDSYEEVLEKMYEKLNGNVIGKVIK